MIRSSLKLQALKKNEKILLVGWIMTMLWILLVVITFTG